MVLTKDDVEHIKKLLLINNQKAEQGYLIALLYVKIGDYEEALKYVSMYLGIKPDSFDANRLQGECYEQLKRNDEALKSYEKALRSKSNSKRGSESHNVDELRKKMEQIRISSSSVGDPQKIPAAKTELMDVEVETVHTPYSTAIADANNDDTRTQITFEFRVNHTTTLDCDDHFETFVFRNLLWTVVLVPNRDLGAYPSLSVYLICNKRNGTTHRWSCHVDAEIRLLSMRPEQCSYVKKTRHLFTKEADAWGFPAFSSWYDVVRPDRDYMRDDCITVQVELKVLE